MSNEVQLRDAGVEVKLRRPSAVATLSVITLGVYTLFWYYKVNREMRDFGSSHGDHGLAASKPWRSIIAVTIGGLVVIPRLVSFVRTMRRVQAVERIATGVARPGSGLTAYIVGSVMLPLGTSIHGIGTLLALAGFAALVAAISLIQTRLNAAWQASGAIAGRSQDATAVAAG